MNVTKDEARKILNELMHDRDELLRQAYDNVNAANLQLEVARAIDVQIEEYEEYILK